MAERYNDCHVADQVHIFGDIFAAGGFIIGAGPAHPYIGCSGRSLMRYRGKVADLPGEVILSESVWSVVANPNLVPVCMSGLRFLDSSHAR